VIAAPADPPVVHLRALALLPDPGPRADDPLEELTPRQREVLELMAEGLSNDGICERLVLSPKTVETHVSGIFWKLGLLPAADCHRRVRAVLTFLSASQPGA
jgi:DNA-binding NarL/FixJ family response regulator